MHTKYKTILVILALAAACPALQLTPVQTERARQVIDYCVNCQFTEALRCADSCATMDPTEPLYQVLRICAIGLRDLDYDATTDSVVFNSAWMKLETNIDKMQQRTGGTAYTLLMRGFGGSMYASYCLRLKEYSKAISNGFAALDMLKAAKKIDPSDADVDFFLGLYACAKADLQKRLSWVLFWYPGSRDKGIAQLERCRDSARITGPGAHLALVDLYIIEKRFDAASGAISALKRTHPSSRFLEWSMGRYCEANRQFAEAAGIYTSLARTYDTIPMAQRNMATSLWMAAQMWDKADRRDKTREVCNQLFERFEASRDPIIRDIVGEAKKRTARILKNAHG